MRRHSLHTLAMVSLLAGVIFASPARAGAVLARSAGSRILGPTAIWTNNTTTPVFHPMGAPVPSAGLVNVRVGFQITEISGPCRARPALRFSNDGVNWNADVAIDATNLNYDTSGNPVYGTAYVDILGLTTPGAWVQFGMQAANATGGTGTGFCNATLRIEQKEK